LRLHLRFASGLLLSIALISCVRAEESLAPAGESVYDGWLRMYDLQFDDAHKVFARWRLGHPTDPLVAVSDAAAYLFAEFDRLGTLESELFISNDRFLSRKKLSPDPKAKMLFDQQMAESDRVTDAVLQKQPSDPTALFAKSLSLGLRADYTAMIEGKNFAALSYTKGSRDYADKLLSVDPQAFDAYLAPGVENYILSLKPAPVRFFLRITGAHTDREKGVEQVQKTAAHGHYLEPFAKLLLAVAALRDKNMEGARGLLGELHNRFPHNAVYTRELNLITPGLTTPGH
jgi:hypothetical protein